MTKAQVLALTVARCDAAMEFQLTAAEIVMRDEGATEQEIEAALGEPNGYMRRFFAADRAAQIREVARWLSGRDNTLH
jgi:hypothetical protein